MSAVLQFDLERELGYEEVEFKPGFRPQGTLDTQDRLWRGFNNQIVGIVWSVVVHSENA